jgi:hypothetical protein
MNFKIAITTVFMALGFANFAQNNSSPYSIMGIGDIEKSSLDRTSGTGHAGVAMFSDRYMIAANPASYVNLNNKFFHFEVNSRFKSTTFQGRTITNGQENQANDLQFKRIALAIKLKNNWAISAGLMPFSGANYSFFGTKNVQGSPQTLNTFNEGSGSTNMVYLANSWRVRFGNAKDSNRLFKNSILNLGFQASYLFGQFNHKESIFSNLTDSILVSETNTFYTNPLFKFGMQFHQQIGKSWMVGIGATAGLQNNLASEESYKITDGSTILKETGKQTINAFKIPSTYTVGLNISHNAKYALLLDYTTQNWGTTNYRGFNYSLVNSNRVSGGFQFTKNYQLRDGSIYEKSFFQIGAFYNKSYLRVAGEQINDYGFTLGAGIQLLGRDPREIGKLSLHANMEIGTRGTTIKNLVKENYTQFGITLCYRDFWFTNVKRYD